MIQLFPVPNKSTQQPLGFCSNSEEQFMNLESAANEQSINSMNISLEKESNKVNSNVEEDDEYTLANESLEVVFSNCLSDMEYRLISYLTLADTLFEGIPISPSFMARRLRRSRTTIIAATKSLVDRNVIEKIKPSKGQEFLYRLLPMDGWQKRETVTRKVQTNVGDVKSNIIDFPNRNVAEDKGSDPWLDDEKVEPIPTIWRSPKDSDSNRYWTTGQIYDDASGIEVVRQCEAEGLVPQQVVKRAIAFSKVPQLILGTIASIAEKLITFIDKLGEEVEKQEAKPAPRKKVIPPVQKLNTQGSQGSRYGHLVNQGQSTNGQAGVEEWYTQKYKEGYFSRPWDMHLYATNNNTEYLTAYRITPDGKSAVHRSESIRALRECWDNSIIHYFWGEDIRERKATVEDYLRWRDGQQNQ